MKHKDDELAAVFGDRLRKLVGGKRGSKLKLARELDISHSNLTNLYNGKYVPTVPTLVAIAKRYNVTTDYLLGVEKTYAQQKAEARGYAAGLRLSADAMIDMAERLRYKAEETAPRKN